MNLRPTSQPTSSWQTMLNYLIVGDLNNSSEFRCSMAMCPHMHGLARTGLQFPLNRKALYLSQLHPLVFLIFALLSSPSRKSTSLSSPDSHILSLDSSGGCCLRRSPSSLRAIEKSVRLGKSPPHPLGVPVHPAPPPPLSKQNITNIYVYIYISLTK
jgi:hypothetical protein